MSIGDLFRSKIKHSDPTVRAEAIGELSGDQHGVLAEIARDDDDFRIRRLALEKIDDAETLIELAKSAAAPIDQMAADRVGELLGREALDDSDEAAALVAIERVAAVGSLKTLSQIAAKANRAAVKEAALASIADDRALADVVREASDEAIALGALAKIANHGAIAAIAVSDPRRAIGLAALERLAERDATRESIERIEAKAAHKAVRTRARVLLAPTAAEQSAAEISPERLAHAERVQLTHTLESLSRAQDFRRAAEFSAATRRFEEVGVGEDIELAGRFERAKVRYLDGLERYQLRMERLAKEGKVDSPEPDAIDEDGHLPAADQTAPTQVVETVAIDAATIAAAEPSEEPVTEASAEKQAALPAVATPRPKPKTFTPEEKRIALESLSQNLESLATSSKVKTINKALARAESKFNELGEPPTGMPELLARLERGRQALLIRAGEIREALEWQQWANIGKQEQLIEHADKLAADEAAGKLGDRLRTLQKEWKELGPAPRDRAQELWERFKVACDKIYERVKAERKEDNEVRKANLSAKTLLCEQAESVSDSEDWAATAQVLKRLQSEWKGLGPVPRRLSDKIWKRFRGACDAFFERRKPHLEEQLAEYRDAIEEKTAIISEMESLISDEARANPLRERGERFDNLARKFQRAGRVPPREFASFRKRQDAVEKALKKELAGRRAAEVEERAALLASLADKIEATRTSREAGELAGEPLASALIAIRAEVKEAGNDGLKEIRKALEKELRMAVELAPDAFKGTDLDPVVSKQRKEKLCKKVEKLVPKDAAAKPVNPEDMAAKLRAALADRALGGVLSKQADPQTIKKALTEARESWRRLGPVPGAEGSALEERFKGACERARRSAE